MPWHAPCYAGRRTRFNPPSPREKTGLTPCSGQPVSVFSIMRYDECLTAQAKTRDQVLVGGLIAGLDIIKQATTLANHRQKTTARTEILFVRLQMLGQIDNTLGQNGNLYGRRA